MTLPYVEDVAHLSFADAVDALEAALVGGLDPEADAPRQSVGPVLVMPSDLATHPAVKLVTVGGEPRIQGLCVVFDRETLRPAALIDGIALTNLRTAAVSALAVRHLASEAAVRAVRPIETVDVIGREGGDDLVPLADVVRGRRPDPSRPRRFRSTGMAWEDAVIASALL